MISRQLGGRGEAKHCRSGLKLSAELAVELAVMTKCSTITNVNKPYRALSFSTFGHSWWDRALLYYA